MQIDSPPGDVAALFGRLTERSLPGRRNWRRSRPSCSAACGYVKAAGPDAVVFVCVVAAPEGVAKMEADHPDVPVWTAAVDRELDERGYIRPGLGDAGDRVFGTG